MDPPRPSLSWHKVVEMASLAEFDLLRDSRSDIRQEPWAKPMNREAMNILFDMQRAHEEIDRLNVEIPRLLTYMYDDHADYYCAVSRLLLSDPAMAHELSERWAIHDGVHAQIAARLRQTMRLPGFSGTVMSGKRIGRQPGPNDVPLPSWAKYCTEANNGGPASDAVADDGILTVGALSEQESDTLVSYVDDLGIREGD